MVSCWKEWSWWWWCCWHCSNISWAKHYEYTAMTDTFVIFDAFMLKLYHLYSTVSLCLPALCSNSSYLLCCQVMSPEDVWLTVWFVCACDCVFVIDTSLEAAAADMGVGQKSKCGSSLSLFLRHAPTWRHSFLKIISWRKKTDHTKHLMNETMKIATDFYWHLASIILTLTIPHPNTTVLCVTI